MKAALVLALLACAACASAQKTTYASLAEALEADPRLTTFAELVKKHTAAFNPDKGFKGLLFAPSNKAWADAFEVLKAAGVPLNPAVIDKILEYHQVATAYYAQDLPEGVALKTNLDGAPLVVSYDNGAIRYNAIGSVAGIAKNAAGTYQDVTIGDAVLNVIDTVLLPFKLGAGKQKLTADGLKPVEDVEPTAKPGASTVGNLPKPAEAAPETADATTGATTGATVGAASILDSAQQAAGNVADAVTGAAGSAANAVGSAVGTAVDAVSNAAGNVKDTLTGAAGSAKDTVQGVVVSLQDRLAALTAGGVDTNIDEPTLGNLTALIDALEYSQLPFKLNPEWVGTIFAPTPEAFEAVRGADGGWAVTPAQMGAVLLAHAVNGTQVFAADIEDGEELVTTAGEKIKAIVEEGTVFLEDAAGERAAVQQADITYGDTVLHLIDRVLFAESAEAPAPQPTNPVSSAVARGPLAALLAGAAAALALVLA